jgi:hypothetical protein
VNIDDDLHTVDTDDPFVPAPVKPVNWESTLVEPPEEWIPPQSMTDAELDAAIDEHFREQDQRRRGRIVSIRQIGGKSWGDYLVGDEATQHYNTAQRTTSALEAFISQLRYYDAAGTKMILDSMAPAGDPSYERTYEDGSRDIIMGGGLSSGEYASQALWLAPIMFGRFVARPGAAVPKANPAKPRAGDPAVAASETVSNATRGWKVGEPINNLTSNGNLPSWSTVRQRYWKNRALDASPGDFTPGNLARMRRGLAPMDPLTGLSKELHHSPPQRNGGLFEVEEVWPWEHEVIDPFRNLGGS